MKFEIERLTKNGRAIVSGELKDLMLDSEVTCTWAGEEFTGVVETRFGDGAVVRLIQRPHL